MCQEISCHCHKTTQNMPFTFFSEGILQLRTAADLLFLTAAARLPNQAGQKPAAPKPSDPTQPKPLDPSKPKPSDPAKKSSTAVNEQKLARADGKVGSMQKAQPSKPPEAATARPVERPAMNGGGKRIMDSSSDSVNLLAKCIFSS